MEQIRCETLERLNALIRDGKLRQLISAQEEVHRQAFFRMAETVCCRSVGAVLMAGPSASGKTTSAHRLAESIRLLNKKAVLLSLDDYYIDRDQILPGPDGKPDLEHINTIDTGLFTHNLQDLLEGKAVQIPTFNFKTGKREWNGHILRLQADSVIIVEGLHALNPVLLPQGVDPGNLLRIYICPQLPPQYRIADHRLRLLRRIVRDHGSRGTSAQRTVAMWDSVRRGEKRWIFPYREKADAVFNSFALYEPAVLKKYILPLLPGDPDCSEILEILNGIPEGDGEDAIPPDSLVREFIGGSIFYR